MGRLYALCGPSGVGKTTFLNELAALAPRGLRFLTRTTCRPLRPEETEGREYVFLSRNGFLQKIFASDFLHVENYSGDLFGIEARPIEEALASEDDAIIMAGAYGATRLRDIYGHATTILYMYTGARSALMSVDLASSEDPCLMELGRRLAQKLEARVLTPGSARPEVFFQARMGHNHVELAYINGRIRSGEVVDVLVNPRDAMPSTLTTFERVRQGAAPQVAAEPRAPQCFVLMPFREQLAPVFEDHIQTVVRRVGLSLIRADRIFSNRPIMDDVLDSVHRARIVIADLTDNNPNVFYETGICHALGKEVILITQDSEVPFDVRHIRHIKYQFTPRGMRDFETRLESTIRAVLAS